MDVSVIIDLFSVSSKSSGTVEDTSASMHSGEESATELTPVVLLFTSASFCLATNFSTTLSNLEFSLTCLVNPKST